MENRKQTREGGKVEIWLRYVYISLYFFTGCYSEQKLCSLLARVSP